MNTSSNNLRQRSTTVVNDRRRNQLYDDISRAIVKALHTYSVKSRVIRVSSGLKFEITGTKDLERAITETERVLHDYKITDDYQTLTFTAADAYQYLTFTKDTLIPDCVTFTISLCIDDPNKVESECPIAAKPSRNIKRWVTVFSVSLLVFCYTLFMT